MTAVWTNPDKWPTRVPFVKRTRRSAKEKAIRCPPPPGERNNKHVNCPLRCPFRAQTHHMTLWGLFQRARGPGQVSKCPLRIKQRCSALQEVSAALLGAVFQPQSVNNQLMDQTTGNLPVIHPNAHKRRPRRRRTCGPSHLPCK